MESLATWNSANKRSNMDRKRVIGPEKSIVPLLEPGSSQAFTFDPENRRDGRNVDRIRPLFMKTGVIRQANGSAYYEAGKMKVTCGVYGPRQTLRSKNAAEGALQCDFKFAPFAGGRRRGYQKDAQEKEYSLILRQALAPSLRLELLPKSVVDVYVQVIESDGSAACLAAAITCTSLALADAGIEMVDTVAACSAGYLNNMTCLDSTGEEEAHQNGTVMLSYMPSLNEVTHVVQSGETNTTTTVKGLELCVDACSQIHSVMQQTLASTIVD
ncbi:ribosomal protein S5 domain 2-type protein [Phlyctochytrium arcticum]|nr:ribosomal protein S5 domain 2-type protein [Phlyctochytrium arcticum]